MNPDADGGAGGKGERKKGKLSNKEKKKMQDRDDRRAGLEWKKGKEHRVQGPGGDKGKVGGKAKGKEKEKKGGKPRRR